MRLLRSRIARLPRSWSNTEIKRYAKLFPGDVVNVSGWQDGDKEGGHYADYFTKKASYTITNYSTKHRGFQDTPGEIPLDLTAPLAPELVGRYDVVFNHTVLEHIYECRTAFANLCTLSRDVVMIVLPFLQPYHSPYGDYWRFSPLAVERMCADNGMTLLYCSFNEHWFSSVYLFAIATKHPERWKPYFPAEPGVKSPITGRRAGWSAIPSVRILFKKPGTWP